MFECDDKDNCIDKYELKVYKPQTYFVGNKTYNISVETTETNGDVITTMKCEILNKNGSISDTLQAEILINGIFKYTFFRFLEPDMRQAVTQYVVKNNLDDMMNSMFVERLEDNLDNLEKVNLSCIKSSSRYSNDYLLMSNIQTLMHEYKQHSQIIHERMYSYGCKVLLVKFVLEFEGDLMQYLSIGVASIELLEDEFCKGADISLEDLYLKILRKRRIPFIPYIFKIYDYLYFKFPDIKNDTYIRYDLSLMEFCEHYADPLIFLSNNSDTKQDMNSYGMNESIAVDFYNEYCKKQ